MKKITKRIPKRFLPIIGLTIFIVIIGLFFNSNLLMGSLFQGSQTDEIGGTIALNETANYDFTDTLDFSEISINLTNNYEPTSELREITITNSGADGALSNYYLDITSRELQTGMETDYSNVFYYYANETEIPQYRNGADVTLRLDLIEGDTVITEKWDTQNTATSYSEFAEYSTSFEGTLNGWTRSGGGSYYYFTAYNNVQFANSGTYALQYGRDYGTQNAGNGVFTEGYAESNVNLYDAKLYFYVGNDDSYRTWNYIRVHLGDQTVDVPLDTRNVNVPVEIHNPNGGTLKIGYGCTTTGSLINGGLSFFIDDVSNRIPTVNTVNYVYGDIATVEGATDFTIVIGDDSETPSLNNGESSELILTPTTSASLLDITTDSTDYDYIGTAKWHQSISGAENVTSTFANKTVVFTPPTNTAVDYVNVNFTEINLDAKTLGTINVTVDDVINTNFTRNENTISIEVADLTVVEHIVNVSIPYTTPVVQSSGGGGGGSVAIPVVEETVEELTEENIMQTSEQLDKEEILEILDENTLIGLFIIVFGLISVLIYGMYKKK